MLILLAFCVSDCSDFLCSSKLIVSPCISSTYRRILHSPTQLAYLRLWGRSCSSVRILLFYSHICSIFTTAHLLSGDKTLQKLSLWNSHLPACVCFAAFIWYCYIARHNWHYVSLVLTWLHYILNALMRWTRLLIIWK